MNALKIKNLKLLALTFIIIFAFSATFAYMLYSEERHSIEQQTYLVVQKDTEHIRSIFQEKISFINSDVILIRDFFKIQDGLFLDGVDTKFRTQQDRENFEDQMLALLNIKNIYDQVRIIDNTGQEIIRVNFNQGDPFIVSEENLQNKSGRYYFSDSIGLDENSLYISKLDLNIENGEIELIDGNKTKPMIRFATPFFDNDGNKLGIIVINYLADDVLSLLSETGSFTYGDFELFNEQGYFLYSPISEREWGFMYDDLLDETFEKYYNVDILNDSTTTVTQTEIDNILFTSTRVSAASISSQTSAFLDSDIDVILDVGDFIIVSTLDISSLEGVKSLNQSHIIILILITLLNVMISKLIDEFVFARREKLKAIEFASKYDLLLSIPNRTYISTIIQNLMAKKMVFTLLFVDLDKFKQINDLYGHNIGDVALKMSAKILNDKVRDYDVVARLGGDEFLVVLLELEDKNIISRICSSMISAFKEPLIIENNKCQLGLSIGISTYPNDGKEFDQLINQADHAMYKAKKDSGNNFVFFK